MIAITSRAALESFLDHRGDWWAYTEGKTQPAEYATGQLMQQFGLDLNSDPLQHVGSQHFIGLIKEFKDFPKKMEEYVRRNPYIDQLLTLKRKILENAFKFSSEDYSILYQKIY